ncbi:MAG TPA: RNA methyltransferase [Paenibacillaceae bacterium]
MSTVRETIVTSPHNARAKRWASLQHRKYRDRYGAFLAEGAHLVKEVLEAGETVEAVVYDEGCGWPAELDRGLAAAAGEIVRASAEVMAKCAATDSPPPVFAVVRKRPADPAVLFRPGALVVVLDGLRDPGNVGTIIRSADAAGADAVVVGRGSADPFSPKAVRSTMGSLFHLPVLEGDLAQLLPEAKARGFRLIGSDPRAERTCYECDWSGSVWLLVGSESEGLSPQAAAQLDECVRIPMRGRAESLNAAMAATVLLFEAMRVRISRD